MISRKGFMNWNLMYCLFTNNEITGLNFKQLPLELVTSQHEHTVHIYNSKNCPQEFLFWLVDPLLMM